MSTLASFRYCFINFFF